MSSTRFGEKNFFRTPSMFYNQKTCFLALLWGCFDIICHLYICYDRQPNFLLHYLLEDFLVVILSYLSALQVKRARSASTLYMVRLGFLSLFWGCFGIICYISIRYISKQNFFDALSVRGLSCRHFKPSFRSLGQTSSESINFIQVRLGSVMLVDIVKNGQNTP